MTNDIDLGSLAGRRDAQSQATLAQEAADAQAQQAKRNDELGKRAEEVERSRISHAIGNATKLDREAYHENVNVAHRPHIYYSPYGP